MLKEVLKNFFRKKYGKRAAAVTAAVCVAVTLSGCRNSPVLTQVVYTKDASKADTTQKQLENTDHGQKRDDLKNKVADSDTRRQTKEKKAVQQKTARDTKKNTASVDQKKNAQDTAGISQKASRKTSSGAGTGTKHTDTSAGGGKGSAKSPRKDAAGSKTGKGKNGSSAKNSAKDGKGGTKDKNSSVNGGKGNGKNGGSKITVTDGGGKKVRIPKNVKTVTAVGPAAVMVEMLGGDGRLAGSSADFTGSSLAQTVFGSKEMSSVQKWWSADGKSHISASNFQKLLKKKPDVCFEISGEDTFTSSQVKQLEKAGIAYMALPALDSKEHLEEAVTIVGTTLRRSSGVKSAKARAQEYTDWVEKTVRETSGKSNGEKYSLYIAKYDSDISYTLKNTNNDLPAAANLTGGSHGKGVAIAWSKSKPELVSTFMKAGGVTNESSRYSRYAQTDGLYVSPMFHQFDPVFSSDAYTYYGGNNIAISADLFVTHRISDGYYYLGSKEFPGIIVADSSIKRKIEHNWFWKYHGGARVEGEADWATGYKSASGNLYYGSVISDYSIYVNPSGLGDWAEGSVESPLEAYWVSNRFSDGSTFSDAEVISKTRAFYKKFFGVSLSDTQIRDILHF